MKICKKNLPEIIERFEKSRWDFEDIKPTILFKFDNDIYIIIKNMENFYSIREIFSTDDSFSKTMIENFEIKNVLKLVKIEWGLKYKDFNYFEDEEEMKTWVKETL